MLLAVNKHPRRAGMSAHGYYYSFSGRASEFSLEERREAVHLRHGDTADGNEIGVGIGNVSAIFKRKGQNYAAIPAMIFDDGAHTVSLSFEIQE